MGGGALEQFAHLPALPVAVTSSYIRLGNCARVMNKPEVSRKASTKVDRAVCGSSREWPGRTREALTAGKGERQPLSALPTSGCARSRCLDCGSFRGALLRVLN